VARTSSAVVAIVMVGVFVTDALTFDLPRAEASRSCARRTNPREADGSQALAT